MSVLGLAKDPELFQAASKTLYCALGIRALPKELGFCCEPFNMIHFSVYL